MRKRHTSITRSILMVLLAAFMLLQGTGAEWLPAMALKNPDVVPENFKVVAENDEATLAYNRREALFRVTSKENGTYFDTKAVEGEGGNRHTRNLQRSDLIFDYVRNQDTGAIGSVDTYSMAQELDQIEREPIENGLRLSFFLGQDELSIHDLPKYVPSEKMVEKVLKKLSKKQRKTLMEHYVSVGDYYQRRKDSGVAQLLLNRLYEYFYEVGEYTEEDLLEDNEAFGVEAEEETISIRAVMDYQLEGKDLLVTLPLEAIEVTGDYPITRITILPYMMSAKQGTPGYMILPDGSGAVLRFDNAKQTASNYSARVYGRDVLRNVYDYRAPTPQLTLPMAAMVYEDHALLAMVEAAQDMAVLTSEVSGKTDEYNKLNFHFNVLEVEQVRTVGSSSVTLPRVSDDRYDGDLRIRYRMIEAADSPTGRVDTVGVAKAYREYLLDEAMLRHPERQPREAGLAVELLGAIEKRRFFLGVPYRSHIALSTLSDMGDMIDDLTASGVDRLHAELQGVFKGGLRQEALHDMDTEKVVGSFDALKELVARDDGDALEISPAVYLTQVFERRGLKANTAFARMLSGEYARLPFENHLLRTSEIDDTRSPYLLSPHYYTDYLADFADGTTKLGADAITVADLGHRIVADYASKRDTARYRAQTMGEEALAYLAETVDRLELSDPNLYALPYADDVTDLPIGHSGNKSFDYDIPFLQWVLEGHVPMSSEALNHELLETPYVVAMHVMEHGMRPKFRLMATEDETLIRTDYDGLFHSEYDKVKPAVLDVYEAYRDFETVTEGSEVTQHKVDGTLRTITYANGTTLYLNYGHEAIEADGHEIEARSYHWVK